MNINIFNGTFTLPQSEAIRTAITRYMNNESADEIIEDPIRKRCDYFNKDDLSWNFLGQDGKKYRCVFPKRHTQGILEGMLYYDEDSTGCNCVSFRANYQI